jgi:hypothetical protein
LIMDSYYGNWQDEQDEANPKGGAKKGFTTTASKRKGDFEKYVGIVAESREAPNAQMWSERLMEVANKELMKSNIDQEESEVDNSENQDTSPIDDKTSVYLKYASRGLGDDDDDDDDDEDDDQPALLVQV